MNSPMDGMQLDKPLNNDGSTWRANRPIHKPLVLPEDLPPGPKIRDPIRVLEPERMWGAEPSEAECDFGWANLGGHLFCMGCGTGSWVEPDVATITRGGELIMRASCVAYGWHRVREQDEAHFSELFRLIHPHVMSGVDTEGLARVMGLAGPAPEQVPVDVQVREEPAVGRLAVDWKLWVFATPKSGLSYRIEYRHRRRKAPYGWAREIDKQRQLIGLSPWRERLMN